MGYKEIIKRNCELNDIVRWWPKFAFHYTDVKNAVSILSSGTIYSRVNAEKLGVMKNDNASRQVIDMTMTCATANVRFYFRPLTPTQYHNEGFKHPALRYDNDKYANTPVPIFLAFDLEKLLQNPKIRFSDRAQSGYGSQLYQSAEDFSRFPFDLIYGNGYFADWQANQKYRHAEILCPDQFSIAGYISSVLCRNAIERQTLLTLLKNKDKASYFRYKNIIKICKENMFEKNGLYVEACQYHGNSVSISFANTYYKAQHSTKEMQKHQLTTLDPVNASVFLQWSNNRGLCYQTTIRTTIDYLNPKPIVIQKLPNIAGAKNMTLRFYLEDDLMCCIDFALENVELIK